MFSVELISAFLSEPQLQMSGCDCCCCCCFPPPCLCPFRVQLQQLPAFHTAQTTRLPSARSPLHTGKLQAASPRVMGYQGWGCPRPEGVSVTTCNEICRVVGTSEQPLLFTVANQGTSGACGLILQRGQVSSCCCCRIALCRLYHKEHRVIGA